MTPAPKLIATAKHPTLYILQSGEGCFCQFRAYEREQLLAAKKDSLSTESLMKAQKKVRKVLKGLLDSLLRNLRAGVI